MVTMQQIKKLLDAIHRDQLQIGFNQSYKPTEKEEQAHIQLVEFFYDRAEMYSKNIDFWFLLGSEDKLPNDFAIQALDVDHVFKKVQQYYQHLNEHKLTLERQKEIDKIATTAPFGWKKTVESLFNTLLMRELVFPSPVLDATITNKLIDGINRSTQLDKRLVREEVNSIIQMHNLTSEFFLKQYCQTIAVNKVFRAVSLAATASGTLVTPNKQNFHPIKSLLISKLEAKQSNPNRWQKPAYRHHFFSPSSHPIFVKPYNNAGAIKSAIDYLRLRLAKHNNVYVQPALQSLKKRDYVANIDDIINSPYFIEHRTVQMYALSRLWQGLKNETNFVFQDPIDQIIAYVCLDKLTHQFQKMGRGEDYQFQYDMAFDLLSLLIANVLRINQGLSQADNYYASLCSPRMPGVALSHTKIDQKGRKVLSTALNCLVDKQQLPNSLPGFPLPSVYGDKEHGYFEIVGLKEEAQKRALHPDDRVRFLGRNTETRYQLDHSVILKLKQDISQWCQNDPRILVLDITLEKRDDELIDLIKSDEIQQLIAKNKLQVVIFKSEQKQQSLGSGKFSAGSLCLMARQEQVEHFNKHCPSTIDDYNLAGFYRKYTADITLEVIEQQTRSAKELALHMQSKLPNAIIIANGPFILLGLDKINSNGSMNDINVQLQHLCRAIWHESLSFGFAQTTISQWDLSMLRVSVGLEPVEELKAAFDEQYQRMRKSFDIPQVNGSYQPF